MWDQFTDNLISNAVWSTILRVLVQPLASLFHPLKKRSPFKSTTICLRHRLHATAKYYEGAFKTGENILYIAIMSQDTLKDMGPRLDAARATGTRIRALTWHAETPPVAVELFRQHLGENADHPERSLQQLRQASADWHGLATQYRNLTVREFRSAPTMQGLIVPNRWALVELMPYGTHRNDRPALLLTPKADPELFSLFASQFEALWDDSEPLVRQGTGGQGKARKGPNR